MEKTGRAATGRDSEKYIIRFPDGMRERLHEAARINNRTLNAELVARLQASFEPRQDATADAQLAMRVEERKNEEKLAIVRNQLATVRMHRDVLGLRLEFAQNAKKPDAQVSVIQSALKMATVQLLDLERELKALLEESEVLMRKSAALDKPMEAKAEIIAAAELVPAMKAASEREATLIAELRALQPSSSELDAALAREQARVRKRLKAAGLK